MKLKIVIVDLEIPRKTKRIALLAGIPLALLLGSGALVYANVKHTFAAGDPLSATTMNENFADLDSRLTAAEAKAAALDNTVYGVDGGDATSLTKAVTTLDNTVYGVDGGAFPLSTGWVKIYDVAYNGNGVQTIPVTSVGGTFTVRIIFQGVIGAIAIPEIYARTSGGGTGNYNSWLTGEFNNGVPYTQTAPVQPGFLMARGLGAGNWETAFDYTITEVPGLLGANGYGTGSMHPDGNAPPLVMHGGGNNEYFSNSTSISIAFWNTSSVSGRFVVLQLK